MTDITNGLAELAEHRTEAPSEDTVATDLARGRAARRSRRLRRGSALSAAVLVIGGTAGYLSVSGQPAAHRGTTASAPLKSHQGSTASASSKIRLAAYTGHQPQGFNVASVPQGFHLQVQASNAGSFILAPPGADKSPYSFVGKLVVTAEAASELGHWESNGDRSVTVHGGQGRIGDQKGSATQLWFSAGHGIVVDVQAWDNIGLTDQQLVTFADGVTTTPALQLGHG
jgi:hypothetical protein